MDKLLTFNWWMEKLYSRRKTPLVISGTQTQILAESMAIAASTLNHCPTCTFTNWIKLYWEKWFIPPYLFYQYLMPVSWNFKQIFWLLQIFTLDRRCLLLMSDICTRCQMSTLSVRHLHWVSDTYTGCQTPTLGVRHLHWVSDICTGC